MTTIAFLTLLLTSFEEEEETYIFFPHEIGILQTCQGQQVEFFVEITSDSKRNVEVHSFFLDYSDFTVFNNNESISKTDTLLVSQNKPLLLKIRYSAAGSVKPLVFNFKTNLNNYTNNVIRLKHGYQFITASEIRSGKEQTIDISESCLDSVSIQFPYGGTVSSVMLYQDSAQTLKKIKSLSYHIGGIENVITLSKADTGRYYVDFGACHWGNEFWLSLK